MSAKEAVQALALAGDDPPADGRRLRGQLGLRAGGLGQLLAHAGVELLPHPRHAEEHRRLHLDEVLQQLVERLGVVHGDAGHGRDVDGEHLLGDVRQRQVRQQPVGLDGAGEVGRLGRRPAQVVVGEHHGLGPARSCPRCRCRSPRRRAAGRPAARRTAPSLPSPRARNASHPRTIGSSMAGASRIITTWRRWGSSSRQATIFCHCVLVLGQEDGGLGVVQDVGALPRRRGRVDPGRDRSGGHGRHVEDDPLGPVGPQDADGLPGLDPEGDQGRPGLADLGGVDLPGGRLPAARTPHVIGGIRPEPLAVAEHELGDRLERHCPASSSAAVSLPRDATRGQGA